MESTIPGHSGRRALPEKPQREVIAIRRDWYNSNYGPCTCGALPKPPFSGLWNVFHHPVANKLYRFCGRKAAYLLTYCVLSELSDLYLTEQ